MEMVMCVFALLSPDNWAPQLGLGNDSYLCFFFLSRKHMKLWQSRNSRTVKVCMQFYICNFFCKYNVGQVGFSWLDPSLVILIS